MGVGVSIRRMPVRVEGETGTEPVAASRRRDVVHSEEPAMPHYLLSVYQPQGDQPSPDALDRIMGDVGEVDREMRAAGVWVFAGGLHAPSTATVLRPTGADVLTTDGPFLEGKEYLGGFTVIRAPDLDAALEWGRRLALATTLPIEVRPFAGGPED
jgi:hypothetical protein